MEFCSAAEADVWNPSTRSAAPGFMMSDITAIDGMPMPMGIFRDVDASCYDEGVTQQVKSSIPESGPPSLRDLVWGGDTWTV
jgi:hypothetical protein